MKIDFFYNEFPLFVLLAGFICFCVRPPYQLLTPLAEDVIDAMEASHQESVFGRPNLDVHAVIEEISSPCSRERIKRKCMFRTTEKGIKLNRLAIGSSDHILNGLTVSPMETLRDNIIVTR